LLGVRNEVKNRSFNENVCIVALTQATMTFHHTIEEPNKTDKKKKSKPN
jgi:hypothetical protein